MCGTARCRDCGCPEGDHVPARYWFRVWRRHYFWALVNKLPALKGH